MAPKQPAKKTRLANESTALKPSQSKVTKGTPSLKGKKETAKKAPAKKEKSQSQGSNAPSSPDENEKPDNEQPAPHPNRKLACNMLCNSTLDPKALNALNELAEDPFGYRCHYRPQWDLQEELEAQEKDEVEVEEECNTAADEWNDAHPRGQHRVHAPGECPVPHWFLMNHAFLHLGRASRGMRLRDPDLLGMYIYNHWAKWGFVEIVQNYISAYGKEFITTKRELKNMWVHVSTLLWFILCEQEYFQLPGDDAEDEWQTEQMVGRMVLSMLDALDQAGQLTPESEYKDLGIVIGLAAKVYEMCANGEDFGMGGGLEWGRMALQYAKSKGINVDQVFAARELMNNHEDVEKEDWHKGGKDAWNFKAAYNKYLASHDGEIGGNRYDITKMSRAERKKAAFDKKDPLADVPLYELNHDMVDLQG